ncbi:MAG: DUF4266 domain-containing protein [Deltaproteobacteria bacterium]|nr:DUF4266 domain-containing protein [Deltaproteobacteria bacterium]
MQPDQNPSEGRLADQIHDRREGSIGGNGISGGGCGCN